MTSRDKFSIPLECPKCEKTGEASCWQEDGYTYMNGNTDTGVNNVTEGFTRVYTKSHWGNDINFICSECGELSARTDN